ncbi:hypothetical protein TNCV_3754881 [Trichonephila clavipes]|nr:hypothetical protein TNCV_3754881 [Trichonephila clavipes]
MASPTIEIEYQVRDLTSEILTIHEKVSKPKTHSEVPFVQDKYGKITLSLWTLKMAPFGELLKRSEGWPPRFQPLMARPELLSAIHTKQN